MVLGVKVGRGWLFAALLPSCSLGIPSGMCAGHLWHVQGVLSCGWGFWGSQGACAVFEL